MMARTRLVRTLEDSGFTFLRLDSQGHRIYRCPCEHAQMKCPSTPGRGRSAANTEAKAKRVLRACHSTQEEAA